MGKPMTDEERARRQRKVEALRRLAENIRGLRNKVTRDLKSDDEKTRLTALAVALMDKTAERVGNEASASKGHFGVTGFQCKHVKVDGDKVALHYVGKSGVEHDKELSDPTIAALLKACAKRCKKPEDPLLVAEDGSKITAEKVNHYLDEYDVTAKDIRGYAANTLVLNALSGAKISEDEKERKRKFSEVLADVAKRVGHGKQTLHIHYLLPGIEDEYVGKGKVKQLREAAMRDRVAARIAWGCLWATR